MVSAIQGMGGGMPPMGGMRPQALTDEQKQTVQDLLEQYDPDDLTAEDAKSLFQSFKDAGVRGPGLREAIQEAGFDADQVWSLAHDGEQPPAPPVGGGQMGGQVNLSSLQSLQSILEQFDLANLSDDQEQSLLSQLNQAGLMNTGGLIDIGA